LRITPGIVLVSLGAFVLGFLLFMPVLCAASSSGPWSCVTILGLELPGFSGRGRSSPSYVPPVLAGVAAFLLAFLLAQLVRRRQRTN
jgi:hypothetical protein